MTAPLKEPLMFTPLVKANIWGGDFLRSRSPFAPSAPCGESWEITDHGADVSVVQNGTQRGKSLRELLPQICGGDGKNNSSAKFPLLLKIIDTRQPLSVQVHPNDDYPPVKSRGELGKTEAWYIADSAVDAKILYGFLPGITREKFAQAIANGCTAKWLREVSVKRGDIFFVPSGMVHALGASLRVIEIQQNSDTTYRVYDWDRRDTNGNARELHIDHALAVSDFTGQSPVLTNALIPYREVEYTRVIDCEKFKFDRLRNFHGDFSGDTAGKGFQILTVVRGVAEVTAEDGSVTLNALDTCLLPFATGKYTVRASHGTDDLELLIFSQ